MALQYLHKQTLSNTDTWYAFSRKIGVLKATDNCIISATMDSDADTFVMHFYQDATGGRTLIVNGTSISVDPAPSAHTLVEYCWDGETLGWISSYRVAGGASKLATPVVSVTVLGSDSLLIEWADIADEINYVLEKSLNGTSWSILLSPPANATSYQDNGLTADTTYYYRVKAVGDGTNFSDSNFGTASGTTTSDTSGWVDSPPVHYSGITSPSAGVYEGTGTGVGLSSRGLMGSKLVAGDDGGIRFKLHANDANGFILGFAIRNTEAFYSDFKVGIYVGLSLQWKVVTEGEFTSAFVTGEIGDYFWLHRVAGVWYVKKSADGSNWTTVYQFTYASNVDMYAVVDLSGKMYYPQTTGTTPTTAPTPAFTTTGYKTADMTEANNGIAKNGTLGWANFYRTAEVFNDSEDGNNYIEFLDGDTTLKDKRIGFTTNATPTDQAGDMYFGINLDSGGGLNRLDLGNISALTGSYLPGWLWRVYKNGRIKRSTDGGVTWTNVFNSYRVAPSTLYGFVAMYSEQAAIHNVKKG